MDETTLRAMAAQLLTELDDQIPDPHERRPVADEITAAMGRPQGEGRLALLLALERHPATRQWMREHGGGPPEDTVRSWNDLGGTPTATVGLYYICPELDHDDVLLTAPEQPPLCPQHRIPMDLVQG